MSQAPNTEIVFANSVVKEATAIEIATHTDAVYAAEVLTRANKALDTIIAKEKERTQRLEEELAFIKAPYIDPKRTLKTIIADLRTKLSYYQTHGIAVAAVEENKIAEKVLSGKLSAEKGVQKLDQVVSPLKRIEVPTGSLSFKSKQTLEIISFEAIPRNYLRPDEDMILKDMKMGLKIAGCVLRTVQVPINRRN